MHPGIQVGVGCLGTNALPSAGPLPAAMRRRVGVIITWCAVFCAALVALRQASRHYSHPTAHCPQLGRGTANNAEPVNVLAAEAGRAASGAPQVRRALENPSIRSQNGSACSDYAHRGHHTPRLSLWGGCESWD